MALSVSVCLLVLILHLLVQAVNASGPHIDRMLGPNQSLAYLCKILEGLIQESQSINSIEAQRATNYLDPRRNTGASGFQQPNVFSDPTLIQAQTSRSAN